MKQTLAPLMDQLALELAPPFWPRLETFRHWLVTEAVEAGGIGPDEGGRIVHRHLGDSLSYAATFPSAPASVIDYGSGVGLPGIPLAILWPETKVILRERSRRRVELLQRAVLILELGNIAIELGELESDHRLHEAIVTRAVLPVERWIPGMGPRLAVGGQAVTSLGGLTVDPELTAPPDYRLHQEVLPVEVLDHAVTFLIMTRTTPGASE